MERVTTWKYNPAIQEAKRMIPQRLWECVPFHLFTEDPIFTGLHSFETVDIDGRSYHQTAHVCYGYYVPDKTTTIVIPDHGERGPRTIIHEFGHVLHEMVDFWPLASPVGEYAQRNIYEAFAEAFTVWIWPECGLVDLRADDQTVGLLEGLYC
jgi:hypothetical protein